MEPTLGKWRQETREFKAILSYTGSFKPELGYMRPLKIEKKKSAKVSSGRAWKMAQSATCLLCNCAEFRVSAPVYKARCSGL